MKKLFLLFAVVCLPALAQNFDQPQRLWHIRPSHPLRP
jgi:hypothetical protein